MTIKWLFAWWIIGFAATAWIFPAAKRSIKKWKKGLERWGDHE